jgi:hypothetical protein
LISALVNLNPPPGGQDNVTDADGGAATGVAISGANIANGSWFYSTDNGANWAALGAVSNANARLLAADANTRVYFQPNAGFAGAIANAITFHAWDQTSGSNGGLGNAGSNGGTTAFSTATDTAALTVQSPANVTLGTGQDNVLYADGASHTITGAVGSTPTLNPGDSITGGSGADTLNLTVNGSTTLDLDWVGGPSDNPGSDIFVGGIDTIRLTSSGQLPNGVNVTLNIDGSSVPSTGLVVDASALDFGNSSSLTINIDDHPTNNGITDTGPGSGAAPGNNFSQTLTGSNGNDLFQMTNTDFNGGSNGQGTVTINGGAGADTIRITDAATIDDSRFATVSGVETLLLGSNATAQSVTLGSNANVAIGTATNQSFTIDAHLAGSVTVTASAAVTRSLVIFGSAGSDTITGGAGSDSITGAAGADTLTGGAGADVFVYTSAADSRIGALDSLTDFTHATDKIDVSAFNFAGQPQTVATNNVGSFTTANTAGFFGTNGVIVQKVGAAEQIYIDVNHDGSFQAAGDLVIRLNTAPIIDQNDFILL